MIVILNDAMDHRIQQTVLIIINDVLLARAFQFQSCIEPRPKPSSAIAVLAVDVAWQLGQIGQCPAEQCLIGEGFGLAPVVVDKCRTEGRRIKYATPLGTKPHSPLTVESYRVDVGLQCAESRHLDDFDVFFLARRNVVHPITVLGGDIQHAIL